MTDIAKYRNEDDLRFVIQNWMRNRNTIEFLGVWEELHNPNFKRGGYIGELRAKIEGDVETDGLDKEKKKEVLKAQRDRVYHEIGVSYLDEGELKNHIEELLDEMDRRHLHILRTGELETLLLPFEVQYTHNKSRWVVIAINKVAELKKEEIEAQEEIYAFLEHIVAR